MPVSRRHAQTADLRTRAADKMQIDLKYVFFLPKSRSKPVLAIWTDGWTEEEIQRVRAMKPEVKAMAATVGAKIYMTPIHPHEQEAREEIRRKSRGPKYRERQSDKRSLAMGPPQTLDGSGSEAIINPGTGDKFRTPGSIAKLRQQMKNKKAKIRSLLRKRGEFCAECGYKGQLTIDHIQSLGTGGTNALSNLRFLCDPCNQAKALEERKKYRGIRNELYEYDPDLGTMVRRKT